MNSLLLTSVRNKFHCHRICHAFVCWFIQAFGYMLSFLYPHFLFRIYCGVKNHIYTGYVRSRFAHFGNSVIQYLPYQLLGEQFIHIGDGNVFEPGLQLTAWNLGEHTPEIRIGNDSLFRKGCHITAVNSIVIGNHLLTGTNVLITDNAHGNSDYLSWSVPPIERPVVSKGKIIIGDRVWLGNNVCVLPGVTIGDGVIVGANSVVTHDVPSYSIVAGNPARIVKALSSSEVAKRQ